MTRTPPLLLATTLLATTLLASPSLAQDADPKPPAAKPDEAKKPDEVKKPDAKPDEKKAPAKPAPKHDEVVLKTGEVLQGTIVQLKGKKLKIKSLQLGEQEVPWDKVAEIRSSKPHTVVDKAGVKHEGMLVLGPNELRVTNKDGTEVTFTKATVTSINPDPPKTELDYWRLNLTIGVTSTYGNTRVRTYAGLFNLTREDDNTRAFLQGTTVYGTNKDGETAKAHRGDGQFDYKITKDFYAILAVGHAFYDKFQNIKLRWRLGSGLGYFILNKPKEHLWNVEAGFAYGETELRRRPPGNRKRYDTSVRVATKYFVKVNSWVTFEAFYETYIGTKRIRDTIHRATFNTNIKIYKNVSLNIAGIYDRVEAPQRGSDGKIPKKDDFKLIIGLGVTL